MRFVKWNESCYINPDQITFVEYNQNSGKWEMTFTNGKYLTFDMKEGKNIEDMLEEL